MRSSLLPLTLLLPSAAAHAAVDVFVCFEGVTGKCTAAVAADLTPANGWIAAASTVISVANSPDPATPYGAGTAQVDRPVELTLPAGLPAPQLLLAALDGEPSPAHVAFRRAGGAKLTMPYLTLDFASLTPYVARAAADESGTGLTLSCDPTGDVTLTYRDSNGTVQGTTTWSAP